MSTETSVSKAHADQLSRVLGILDAMDCEGNEAIVVADIRDAIENRAERIHWTVEAHDIQTVDDAELRTLATFCDQLATRALVKKGHTKKRAKTLADIAAERIGGGDE